MSYDEGNTGLFTRNIGRDYLAHKEGKLEERLVDVTKYMSQKPYKEGKFKIRRLVWKATINNVL